MPASTSTTNWHGGVGQPIGILFPDVLDFGNVSMYDFKISWGIDNPIQVYESHTLESPLIWRKWTQILFPACDK